MAETYANKYEGKLEFTLQTADGLDTKKRTITVPLGNQTISSAEWSVIKSSWVTMKPAWLSGAMSTVIQPTGWRDTDESTYESVSHEPYSIIDAELSVVHTEVFGTNG